MRSLSRPTPACALGLLLLVLGGCSKPAPPPPQEYSAVLTVQCEAGGGMGCGPGQVKLPVRIADTQAPTGEPKQRVMLDERRAATQPYAGQFPPGLYRAGIAVTQEKVRIEFEPAPSNSNVFYIAPNQLVSWSLYPYWGQGRQVVMQFADQDGWVISPADRTSSQLADDNPGMRLALTHLLFSLRPEGGPASENPPCAGQNALPPNESEAPCKRLGIEKVNGREAVKWGTSVSGYGEHSWWVDRSLGVVVKSSASGLTMELTNINQRAQEAALFQPPAGFTRK